MRKEKIEELKSYIEQFKTIKREEVVNNKNFLQIKKGKYYLNNGKSIIREEIVKNNNGGSAAIILPITKENNTLLVVEPRVLTSTGVGVAFPSGYIEEKENAYDAALRELKEETGYVPDELKLLASFYQDEGCSRAFNHAFLALNCERKFEQNLDKDEYIKYFECTYDEALELSDMGYINSSNSIIALEKTKSYLKKRGI